VIEAFVWGLVAASSLLVGGLVALRWRIEARPLGLVMAFGAGVLLSAVAYDLVQEAADVSSGGGVVGLGLAAGALTFFAGDTYIARMGGAGRKRIDNEEGGGGSALAIVLGIVLDGIPESIVIGLTLVSGEGIGIAIVVAVFLSNIPEAIAATTGLRSGGWPPTRIIGLWALVAIVSGLASLGGYAILGDTSGEIVAFVDAFAAGAILTMLATTMMPEAYQHGGRLVGLATTIGFGVAFGLTSLD
jgi:zinc transporter, ZIP family